MADYSQLGYGSWQPNGGPVTLFPTEYPGWDIIERLSEGGQGRIFLVKKKGNETGRHFVLKHPKTPLHFDHIRNEAKALSLLDHPNIIKLIDFDIESDRPFIVTEFLPGETLKNVDLSGWIDKQKLELFHTISEAVSHSHNRGIVHRNIDPSNVILSDDGITPILIDYAHSQISETGCIHSVTDICQMGQLFYWLFEQKQFLDGWGRLHDC